MKILKTDAKDQEIVAKEISKLLKPIVTESTSSFSAIKNILQ